MEWCRDTINHFVDRLHQAASKIVGIEQHLAIAAFPLILQERPRFKCVLRPSRQLHLTLGEVFEVRYAIGIDKTLANDWIPECMLFPEVLQIHETPQCELVCNSKRFKIFFST